MWYQEAQPCRNRRSRRRWLQVSREPSRTRRLSLLGSLRGLDSAVALVCGLAVVVDERCREVEPHQGVQDQSEGVDASVVGAEGVVRRARSGHGSR